MPDGKGGALFGPAAGDQPPSTSGGGGAMFGPAAGGSSPSRGAPASGSKKKAPSLLGQIGGIVKAVPSGLIGLGRDFGRETATAFHPSQLPIVHHFVGAPGPHAGETVAQQHSREHPFTEQTVGSFGRTLGDLRHPTHFTRASDEGSIAGKVLEDAANLSLVLGPLAKGAGAIADRTVAGAGVAKVLHGAAAGTEAVAAAPIRPFQFATTGVEAGRVLSRVPGVAAGEKVGLLPLAARGFDRAAMSEGTAGQVLRLSKLDPQSRALRRETLNPAVEQIGDATGRQVKLGRAVEKVLPDPIEQQAMFLVGEGQAPALAKLKATAPDRFDEFVTEAFGDSVDLRAAHLAADVHAGAAPEVAARIHEALSVGRDAAGGRVERTEEYLAAKPGRDWQTGFAPDPVAIDKAVAKPLAQVGKAERLSRTLRARAEAASAALGDRRTSESVALADRAQQAGERRLSGQRSTLEGAVSRQEQRAVASADRLTSLRDLEEAAKVRPPIGPRSAQVDVRATKLAKALGEVDRTRAALERSKGLVAKGEDRLATAAEKSVPTIEQATREYNKAVKALSAQVEEHRGQLRSTYVTAAAKRAEQIRGDLGEFFREGPLAKVDLKTTQADWLRNLPPRVREAMYGGLGTVEKAGKAGLSEASKAGVGSRVGGLGPDEFMQNARSVNAALSGLSDEQIAEYFAKLYDDFALLRKAKFTGAGEISAKHLRAANISDPYLEAITGTSAAEDVARSLAEDQGVHPPDAAALQERQNAALTDAGGALVAAQSKAEEAFAASKKPVERAVPKGWTVSDGGDAVPGGYKGYKVLYDDQGRKAGYVDYQVITDKRYADETIHIEMIHVDPAFQRQGLASLLLDQVKQEFPGWKVDPGMLTDEGAKWWASAQPQKMSDVRARLMEDVRAEHGDQAATLAGRHFAEMVMGDKMGVAEAKVPVARQQLGALYDRQGAGVGRAEERATQGVRLARLEERRLGSLRGKLERLPDAAEPANVPPTFGAGKRLGSAEARAASAESLANRSEAVLGRLRERVKTTAEATANSVGAAPARLRPVLEVNRRAAEQISGHARDLRARGLHDAADLVEKAGKELPTTLKALESAGVDPEHFIHVQVGDKPQGRQGATNEGARLPRLKKARSEKFRGENLTFDRTIRAQTQGEIDEARAVIARATFDKIGKMPFAVKLGEGPLAGMTTEAEAFKAGYKPWNPRVLNETGRVSKAEERLVAQGNVGTTVFVPAHIHDGFRSYFNDPTREQILRKTYDPAIQGVKVGQLALSPSWQVGNVVGNALMATMGAGVDPVTLGAKIVEAVKKYRASGPRGERTFEGAVAPRRLLTAGPTHAEFRFLRPPEDEVLGRYPRLQKVAQTASAPVRAVANASYAANEFVDNVGRSAVFLAKKDRGLSDEAAVKASLQAMGDFSRMTPMERRVVRRVIPYYAWSRHITQLAFRLPIEHPLRVAWTLALANEHADPTTRDLPGSLAGAIRLPGGKLLEPGRLFPFGDAGRVLEPAGIESQLSPAIRIPVQAREGVNLGTGKPFSRPPGTGRHDEFGAALPTAPSVAHQVGGLFPQKRLLDSLTGRDRVARYDTGQKFQTATGTIATGKTGGLGLLRFLGVPVADAKTAEEMAKRVAEKQKANAKAKAGYERKSKR